MTLTRLAVYRPVIALTATLALLMFGVLSYFSLGLEQNPQLKLPIVTMQVTYPGASAQTVEEQVTRRVEDAIAGLGNIKTLSSVSRTGLAVVTVEFQEGVDVDVAASDVQQRVSGARRDLLRRAPRSPFRREPGLARRAAASRGRPARRAGDRRWRCASWAARSQPGLNPP